MTIAIIGPNDPERQALCSSGMHAIAGSMGQDEEPEPSGLIHALRERTGVIIGVIGLFAWFAMVWLMFGDVL